MHDLFNLNNKGEQQSAMVFEKHFSLSVSSTLGFF